MLCTRCQTTITESLYNETGCLAFWQAIHQAKHKPWLTIFSPVEYSRMRCILRDDGKAGYALTDDGEIVSLFNVGERGAGRGALADAIRRGGRHLCAFDGFLTTYYRRSGFVETSRVSFDDALAPSGWDYEASGRPDVVFMHFEEVQP